MDASISGSDDNTIAMSRSVEGRTAGDIISEGVLAGIIAASAVALVFLVVDLLAGEVLRTPKQLGVILLQAMGASPSATADSTSSLALYTLFHFVSFSIAGIIAAFIVQLTLRKPIAVLLFVILFAAFEVIFTGFVAFLDVKSNTGVTPMQVALGNVVASIAMAIFFLVRHPNLRRLGKALEADE